ncbi:MAG: long-chain fatty acid--CoA ligase [Bacteroidetes bacterium]|nr:MAG: long-chain fatty acid--CoA ligase [Bacteroidota bacterium]
MTIGYNLVIANANDETALSWEELLAYVNTPQTLHNVLHINTLKELVLGMCIRLVNNAPIVLLDGVLAEAIPSMSAENTTEVLHVASRPIANVQELRTAIQASNSTVCIFTSGTTGEPKQVRHTVASLTRTVRTGAKYAENIWAFAYNYTHMAGLQVFFQAVLNGNTMVDVFGKSKTDVVNDITANHVTHISATPTFFRLLLPLPEQLPSLKKLSVGGEKSSEALIAALVAAFPKASINNIYASTEAGTLLHAHGSDFAIPTHLSQFICIRDGQLCVHASLLGHSSSIVLNDDWFETGDLVEFTDDTQSRFRFVSRQSEIINVGGNKVSPHEVEDAILALPEVTQAKVYARFNSILGNLLVADVVSKNPTVSEKWIRDALSQRLQDFKIPRKVNFVSQISLTRTGKLQR